MRIFSRHGDPLERELRARRPQPRADFLAALTSRVDGARGHRRGGSFRVALACALTASVLAVLGGFGGLGYAASGVSGAAQAALHVVTPAPNAVPNSALSSAMAQYKVPMCFHGHTISVDSHAVNALLAAGATLGACHGGSFTPAAKLARMCFKGHNVTVAKRNVQALKKYGFKKGFCKTTNSTNK